MSAVHTIERIRLHLQESLFHRMVVASIGLHIVVVLFFTIRTYVLPEEALNLETAIKVDLVALPDKAQELPPVMEETKPEEEKKVEPPPKVEKTTKKEAAPKKLDLNAKKKAKADALEKLKAMAAIENIKDEVHEAESEKRRQQKASQPVKGNILSKGTALRGIVSNQVAGYVHLLERHAKDNWVVPKWLEDLNLKARAQVYLEKDGTVSKRIIVQSSGNETYDDLVLSSIDRSSPFPAPPEHFVDLVKTKGIQLGFPE